MKAAYLFMLFCGAFLVGGSWLLLGGTAQTFIRTGNAMTTGRVAVVPVSTPIAADCGQAATIGNNACRLQIQEYDPKAMTALACLQFLGTLVGFGFLVFAAACLTMNR